MFTAIEVAQLFVTFEADCVHGLTECRGTVGKGVKNVDSRVFRMKQVLHPPFTTKMEVGEQEWRMQALQRKEMNKNSKNPPKLGAQRHITIS